MKAMLSEMSDFGRINKRIRPRHKSKNIWNFTKCYRKRMSQSLNGNLGITQIQRKEME
jgi:hypothetical protein